MLHPSWRFLKRLAVPTLCVVPAVFMARADYPTSLKALQPVGYWRLDETATVPNNVAFNSGTLGDIGPGYYLKDGTVNGAVIHPAPGALVAEPGNTAATFTGGQYIIVPNKPEYNLQGSFTIEAWIQPSADPTGLICPLSYAQSGSPRSGWFLYQNNVENQGWNFRMFQHSGLNRALDISGGAVPVTGTWYHIAISYDAAANLTILYVNGSSVASAAPVGYVPNIDGLFSIGARSDDGFGYEGALDEVALYDHPVPAATLLAHYNNGISSSPSQPYATLVKAEKPILYYRLDEPAFSIPSTLPSAINLGSYGAGGNATYDIGTTPGKTGVPGNGFPAGNNAVQLNGQNGSVIIPAGQPLNTDSVTYTAWVKPSGPQASFSAVLFQRGVNGGTTKATGFGFGDQQDIRMHWEDGEYGWIPGIPIPANVWNFIAAIVTPTNTTLFVNGTYASHDAVHAAHDFSSDPINIGLDPTGGRVISGWIDEVAIFDKSLTTANLLSLYAAAQLPPEISGQPVAPTGSVFEGASVQFSITAVGSLPLTYTWWKGSASVGTGTSLSFTNVTAGNSGTYVATVRNAYGTLTSAPVVLTVIAGPPVISKAPADATRYPGGTVSFQVAAGGSLPISYQWFHAGSAIAGATNKSVTIPNLIASDAGDYAVAVTNPYGSVTNHATLTLQAIAGSYLQQVLSSGAIAYWPLNENSGSTFTDLVGGYSGPLNATVATGLAGPTGTGFPTPNTGFGFNGTTSDLTAPALNINNNSVTITAWFQPTAAQQTSDVTGLVFSRGSLTTAAGLQFQKNGNLGYTWNNNADTYNWDSGLSPTIGSWQFVALVIEPTQATIYLDSGSGLQSAVNPVANFPEVFDGLLHFGTDPSGNRLFIGNLANVSFFGHSLTQAEVQKLVTAGTTGVFTPTPVAIGSNPLGFEGIAGDPFAMQVSATGSQPLSYQWQKNNQDIPGAIRATYSVGVSTTADSGNYHAVVSNGSTRVQSADAVVTIHAIPTYAVVTNELVLHLPFDSGYSDTSGKHNNGTPVGTPSIVAGKVGAGALHYHTEGVSGNITTTSYVELGSPSDLDFGPGDDFSVAFWVRFTGLSGDLPFLGNTLTSYQDTGIDFAPSYNQGSWSWYLKDYNPSAGTAGLYSPVQKNMNDGTWHHLVHVFSRSGNALTYLDGVKVNVTSISALADADFRIPNQTWEIGQAGGGNYQEPGSFDMDDMGVWRRALTDYEARSIYLAGNVGHSFDQAAPPTVTLTIQQSGNLIIIGYPTGTLQSSTSPAGPFTAVLGASAPTYTVVPSAGAPTLFYRVSF